MVANRVVLSSVRCALQGEGQHGKISIRKIIDVNRVSHIFLVRKIEGFVLDCEAIWVEGR